MQVAQIPGSAQRKICAKFYLTKYAGYGILEYSAQEERLRRDILSHPKAAVNRQFQQKIEQVLCNLPYQYFIIQLHAKTNYRVSFPRYLALLPIR